MKDGFVNKRRFFVMIHTVSQKWFGNDHVLSQTAIAHDHGADGVFLIPDYAKGKEVQASSEDQFLYIENLKRTFPDFLIGANFLMYLALIEEKIYTSKLDLLQTDSSSLDGLNKEKLPATELFCGVAFKYSRHENITGPALEKHCLGVANACNVPTTSGKATGVSADIEKIKEIRSYLPAGKRLGIASGITEENVTSYINAGVTDFLVATSLVSHVDELYRDILDTEKVLSLAAKIHSA